MTIVVSEDQDHTVSITKDVERLEVQPHVTIAPKDLGPAIFSDHIDSVILNSGLLRAYDGVVLNDGDGDRFVNKSHGAIHATESGVRVSDAGPVQLINHGEITGQYGVVLDNIGIASLTNDGVISAASSAVLLTGSGHQPSPADLYVQNSGVIEASDQFGLAMGDPSVALYLTNDGTLGGGAGAIHGQMDYAQVINSGTISGGLFLGEALRHSSVQNDGRIEGDVHLGQVADDEYDGEYGLESVVTGVVYGGGGNDTLTGGYGSDRFCGGAGADLLQTVQGGAATFIYERTGDSTAAAHDFIGNWQESDKLDLSRVDADKGADGRQHVVFGGQIEAGAPAPVGQVVFYHQGGDTFVLLNHNGGGEGSNLLIQIGGTVTLDAGDFVL